MKEKMELLNLRKPVVEQRERIKKLEEEKAALKALLIEKEKGGKYADITI